MWSALWRRVLLELERPGGHVRVGRAAHDARADGVEAGVTGAAEVVDLVVGVIVRRDQVDRAEPAPELGVEVEQRDPAAGRARGVAGDGDELVRRGGENRVE